MPIAPKIDVAMQRLARLALLCDNALFLGHNAPVCLSSQDYRMLKPNGAYVADNIGMLCPLITHQDVGICDTETPSMLRAY
jgi:hypothetical protein